MCETYEEYNSMQFKWLLLAYYLFCEVCYDIWSRGKTRKSVYNYIRSCFSFSHTLNILSS